MKRALFICVALVLLLSGCAQQKMIKQHEAAIAELNNQQLDYLDRLNQIAAKQQVNEDKFNMIATEQKANMDKFAAIEEVQKNNDAKFAEISSNQDLNSKMFEQINDTIKISNQLYAQYYQEFKASGLVIDQLKDENNRTKETFAHNDSLYKVVLDSLAVLRNNINDLYATLYEYYDSFDGTINEVVVNTNDLFEKNDVAHAQMQKDINTIDELISSKGQNLIKEITEKVDSLHMSIDSIDKEMNAQYNALSDSILKLAKDKLDNIVPIVDKMKHDYDAQFKANDVKDTSFENKLNELVATLDNTKNRVKNLILNNKPMLQYEKGRENYFSKNYKTAISDYQSFLANYPKHAYAPNAYYWIGECYYAQSDFKKAISNFETVIKKYPKTDKAIDAKFKIALSKKNMNELDAAIEILNEIKTEHPDYIYMDKVDYNLFLLNQAKQGL